MAAINFPDAPTNGQIFESGGMSWTYVAGIGWTLNSAIVEAGSGFTFIADTMPLPVNVGDTWFDSSTGASGGTSWVAVEEGPAGASEKVWVQFAPGQAAMPPPLKLIGARYSRNADVGGISTGLWTVPFDGIDNVYGYTPSAPSDNITGLPAGVWLLDVRAMFYEENVYQGVIVTSVAGYGNTWFDGASLYVHKALTLIAPAVWSCQIQLRSPNPATLNQIILDFRRISEIP